MRAPAQRFLVAWLFMVVAACSLLPQPRTIEDTVFATAATVRQLREATADRRDAGVITQEDALAISAQLDRARTYVDVAATALELSRPDDARTAIDLAIAILDGVQKHER